MNEALHYQPLPDFDDPWRRLPWVAMGGIALWIGLLAAFSLVLQTAEPPPSNLKPLEARIVEIPPPVTGGLGAPAQPAKPAATPAPAKPKAPLVHRTVPHPSRKIEAPPMPVSPNGIATPAAGPTAAAGAPAEGSATTTGGAGEGGGSSGTGIGGTDNLGAHAIYAPTPEIPDDLREEVIHAVAVAHFKVSYDGQVSVSLVTKTPNPRLNQVLLDTLQQWKFFPAMKDGIAIDSEFDLKIPITVQ